MLLPPGKRRVELERWFEESLLPLFGHLVLSVTHAVAERWGRISAERQLSSVPMGTADGLIAGTTLDHARSDSRHTQHKRTPKASALIF